MEKRSACVYHWHSETSLLVVSQAGEEPQATSVKHILKRGTCGSRFPGALKKGQGQQLDTEIESIVACSREGQILMSMGIGPISAATIIASIGHIANFEKPSELRAYFGWAPVEN